MGAADETEAPLETGRYWEMVGIETVEAVDGTATCRVDLDERHLNYNDVVHGGVTSGLIDSAAGSAVRSLRTMEDIRERPHATTDLHVSYLSGARGSELVAHARVIRQTRTAIFVEVDVLDERERPVARGLTTFVITQGRPASNGA
ncbi:MAG: PaaI family thioesterase [Dehalococcoidia bacterium]|nr:PaaI family thioesterase [Dehalococcoidia bacterium]